MKPTALLRVSFLNQLNSVRLYYHSKTKKTSFTDKYGQNQTLKFTKSWALMSACSMLPAARPTPPFHCNISWTHASRLSSAEGGAFNGNLHAR